MGGNILVLLFNTCHSKIEKLHYFEPALMEQQEGWVSCPNIPVLPSVMKSFEGRQICANLRKRKIQ